LVSAQAGSAASAPLAAIKQIANLLLIRRFTELPTSCVKALNILAMRRLRTLSDPAPNG
jgi:hypothetical protein